MPAPAALQFSVAAVAEADPRLPLERLCSSVVTPFQLGFARKAMKLLSERESLACEATGAGLVVRSETEAALERALGLLREVYGAEALRIGPPTVRCRQTDRGMEEPHMGVQIRCLPAQLERVRDDLVRRGAEIVEAHRQGPIAVVRATAPLARLIGYAQALDALSGGDAHPVMWFSHYAPLESAGPPGGTAA